MHPVTKLWQDTASQGAAGALPWLLFPKPSHPYKRDSFIRVLLPPSASILHGNSSQQLLRPKKEVSASSEVARHKYLHCQSSSKSNTCPARKEAPDLPAQENHTTALQTNTYKNLPCTSTDQLFTKTQQWIISEINWYWGRCKFLLGYSETPYGFKRAGISLPVLAAERQENCAVVCTQSVTSLPSLYTRKCSFIFPQRSSSHATFNFQRPFLLRKSQTFILLLLFSALDFSPGRKSQHIRLKLCFSYKLSLSFFKLSGLVFKVGTPRTILDLAVCTQTPELPSSAQMRTSIMSVSGNSGLWSKLLTLPLLSGGFPWLEFSATRRRESWSPAQIQQQIVPCKYNTIFWGGGGAHL